uniref:C2H2-type domain-containing protein n=1 Tax=Timema cristinae TaxID=61476 RepID=A0A7R9DA35_TIMCR|nr:unnamed protein product [Timema cristinae]
MSSSSSGKSPEMDKSETSDIPGQNIQPVISGLKCVANPVKVPDMYLSKLQGSGAPVRGLPSTPDKRFFVITPDQLKTLGFTTTIVNGQTMMVPIPKNATAPTLLPAVSSIIQNLNSKSPHRTNLETPLSGFEQTKPAQSIPSELGVSTTSTNVLKPQLATQHLTLGQSRNLASSSRALEQSAMFDLDWDRSAIETKPVITSNKPNEIIPEMVGYKRALDEPSTSLTTQTISTVSKTRPTASLNIPDNEHLIIMPPPGESTLITEVTLDKLDYEDPSVEMNYTVISRSSDSVTMSVVTSPAAHSQTKIPPAPKTIPLQIHNKASINLGSMMTAPESQPVYIPVRSEFAREQFPKTMPKKEAMKPTRFEWETPTVRTQDQKPHSPETLSPLHHSMTSIIRRLVTSSPVNPTSFSVAHPVAETSRAFQSPQRLSVATSPGSSGLGTLTGTNQNFPTSPMFISSPSNLLSTSTTTSPPLLIKLKQMPPDNYTPRETNQMHGFDADGIKLLTAGAKLSPRRRRVTKKRRMLSSFTDYWNTSLQENGFIRCPLRACNYISLHYRDMSTHYAYCTGSSTVQTNMCHVCAHRLGSERDLLDHMAISHSHTDIYKRLLAQHRVKAGKLGQPSPVRRFQVSPHSATQNHDLDKQRRPLLSPNKTAAPGRLNTNLIINKPAKPDDEFKLFRKRSYSAVHKTCWRIAIESKGYVKCFFQNCNFLALNMEDMVEHYGVCNGSDMYSKFMCPFCNGGLKSLEMLHKHISMEHMEESHAWNSESLSREDRTVTDSVKSVCNSLLSKSRDIEIVPQKGSYIISLKKEPEEKRQETFEKYLDSAPQLNLHTHPTPAIKSEPVYSVFDDPDQAYEEVEKKYDDMTKDPFLVREVDTSPIKMEDSEHSEFKYCYFKSSTDLNLNKKKDLKMYRRRRSNSTSNSDSDVRNYLRIPGQNVGTSSKIAATFTSPEMDRSFELSDENQPQDQNLSEGYMLEPRLVQETNDPVVSAETPLVEELHIEAVEQTESILDIKVGTINSSEELASSFSKSPTCLFGQPAQGDVDSSDKKPFQNIETEQITTAQSSTISKYEPDILLEALPKPQKVDGTQLDNEQSDYTTAHSSTISKLNPDISLDALPKPKVDGTQLNNKQSVYISKTHISESFAEKQPIYSNNCPLGGSLLGVENFHREANTGVLKRTSSLPDLALIENKYIGGTLNRSTSLPDIVFLSVDSETARNVGTYDLKNVSTPLDGNKKVKQQLYLSTSVSKRSISLQDLVLLPEENEVEPRLNKSVSLQDFVSLTQHIDFEKAINKGHITLDESIRVDGLNDCTLNDEVEEEKPGVPCTLKRSDSLKDLILTMENKAIRPESHSCADLLNVAFTSANHKTGSTTRSFLSKKSVSLQDLALNVKHNDVGHKNHRGSSELSRGVSLQDLVMMTGISKTEQELNTEPYELEQSVILQDFAVPNENMAGQELILENERMQQPQIKPLTDPTEHQNESLLNEPSETNVPIESVNFKTTGTGEIQNHLLGDSVSGNPNTESAGLEILTEITSHIEETRLLEQLQDISLHDSGLHLGAIVSESSSGKQKSVYSNSELLEILQGDIDVPYQEKQPKLFDGIQEIGPDVRTTSTEVSQLKSSIVNTSDEELFKDGCFQTRISGLEMESGLSVNNKDVSSLSENVEDLLSSVDKINDFIQTPNGQCFQTNKDVMTGPPNETSSASQSSKEIIDNDQHELTHKPLAVICTSDDISKHEEPECGIDRTRKVLLEFSESSGVEEDATCNHPKLGQIIKPGLVKFPTDNPQHGESIKSELAADIVDVPAGDKTEPHRDKDLGGEPQFEIGIKLDTPINAPNVLSEHEREEIPQLGKETTGNTPLVKSTKQEPPENVVSVLPKSEITKEAQLDEDNSYDAQPENTLESGPPDDSAPALPSPRKIREPFLDERKELDKSKEPIGTSGFQTKKTEVVNVKESSLNTTHQKKLDKTVITNIVTELAQRKGLKPAKQLASKTNGSKLKEDSQTCEGTGVNNLLHQQVAKYDSQTISSPQLQKTKLVGDESAFEIKEDKESLYKIIPEGYMGTAIPVLSLQLKESDSQSSAELYGERGTKVFTEYSDNLKETQNLGNKVKTLNTGDVNVNKTLRTNIEKDNYHGSKSKNTKLSSRIKLRVRRGNNPKGTDPKLSRRLLLKTRLKNKLFLSKLNKSRLKHREKYSELIKSRTKSLSVATVVNAEKNLHSSNLPRSNTQLDNYESLASKAQSVPSRESVTLVAGQAPGQNLAPLIISVCESTLDKRLHQETEQVSCTLGKDTSGHIVFETSGDVAGVSPKVEELITIVLQNSDGETIVNLPNVIAATPVIDTTNRKRKQNSNPYKYGDPTLNITPEASAKPKHESVVGEIQDKVMTRTEMFYSENKLPKKKRKLAKIALESSDQIVSNTAGTAKTLFLDRDSDNSAPHDLVDNLEVNTTKGTVVTLKKTGDCNIPEQLKKNHVDKLSSEKLCQLDGSHTSDKEDDSHFDDTELDNDPKSPVDNMSNVAKQKKIKVIGNPDVSTAQSLHKIDDGSSTSNAGEIHCKIKDMGTISKGIDCTSETVAKSNSSSNRGETIGNKRKKMSEGTNNNDVKSPSPIFKKKLKKHSHPNAEGETNRFQNPQSDKKLKFVTKLKRKKSFKDDGSYLGEEQQHNIKSTSSSTNPAEGSSVNLADNYIELKVEASDFSQREKEKTNQKQTENTMSNSESEVPRKRKKMLKCNENKVSSTTVAPCGRNDKLSDPSTSGLDSILGSGSTPLEANFPLLNTSVKSEVLPLVEEGTRPVQVINVSILSGQEHSLVDLKFKTETCGNDTDSCEQDLPRCPMSDPTTSPGILKDERERVKSPDPEIKKGDDVPIAVPKRRGRKKKIKIDLDLVEKTSLKSKNSDVSDEDGKEEGTDEDEKTYVVYTRSGRKTTMRGRRPVARFEKDEDERDTDQQVAAPVVRGRGRGRPRGRPRGRGRGRGAMNSSGSAAITPGAEGFLDSSLEDAMSAVARLQDDSEVGKPHLSAAYIALQKKRMKRRKKGKRIGRKSTGPLLRYDEMSESEMDIMGKCAKCQKEMLKGDFLNHSLHKHTGMAWMEGEEPFDFEDEKILTYVVTRAWKMKIPLRCEFCLEFKRSVVGFISHIQFCQKTSEAGAMYTTKTTELEKRHLTTWKRNITISGKATCRNVACKFESGKLEELKKHFISCPHTQKKVNEAETVMEKHVTGAHNKAHSDDEGTDDDDNSNSNISGEEIEEVEAKIPKVKEPSVVEIRNFKNRFWGKAIPLTTP